MFFNLRNSAIDRRKEKHLARFNIEDSAVRLHCSGLDMLKGWVCLFMTGLQGLNVRSSSRRSPSRFHTYSEWLSKP